MLDQALLAEIVQFTYSKGIDFAEIYVEEKLASSIFCEDDQIEKVHSGRERGAGIRVVKDYNTAYVYTNDLSRKGLMKAAGVARDAIGGRPSAIPQLINLTQKEAAFHIAYQRLPVEVAFEEKIQYVMQANQAARRVSGLIRQVTVAAADVHKKIQIANSAGELIEDDRTRVRLLVNTVSESNGIIQTGYESAGGVCGWELLEQVSFDDIAVKAAELSVRMLSAKPAPAGRMTVVMSSEAGGTMVHEACGHGLEADLIQKGLSVYRGKIGVQVAASGVSVIDDATISNKYGSFRFDDEGTPGQRTVLIEDGILINYLYDRLTAQKDGRISTGNGRRESYQHKPVVRMSNTLISPGQENPEEIIAATSSGLLVKKMGGGQVNTTNGDFVFDVQEGYLIQDGKIKYPVRGATLTGNGPMALANIDKVGNDLGFSIGVCGKDGQGVPVSDAQPTIRIKELTVGGTMVSSGQ
ncbi:tldd protein, part of putative tlde/tldd proteolytic complex [hydrocarbon metagenome]|uniref:Tldd protein, part of putative tlde/tldd proteolytic complex n=1 Tax=hydrocarbon metagenome TaxID=938273 RepID=A0A0W8E8T7_9ZZZZ